ncbi:MAG: phosphatidate cytidylyltransferase [Dehalococcoidia bacterium]|nr:MAG: phosphatidate cytidylyltransferase [Dehalococcoidia bacterium]
MLRQRLLVAAVGLPVLALLLATSEQVLAAGVTILLAATAYEMAHAARPQASAAYPMSAAAAVALFAAASRAVPGFPLVPFVVMAAVTLALLLHPQGRIATMDAGWWLGTTLYVGLGAHLILLRGLEDGRAWCIVLLVTAFATDTGAYSVGRLVGKHLLWPAVSPRKTWEGAFGGMVAGLLGFTISSEVFGLDFDMDAAWIGIGFALPLAAIGGDLLESAVKRKMGVKDASHLLPGHGGLLDRFDSVLVVGVCLYWAVRWL